jgi:hypothetical protein
VNPLIARSLDHHPVFIGVVGVTVRGKLGIEVILRD